LLRPDGGRITLAGRTLVDRGTCLPAHRRGVAMLAQEPLLFPRMSALDNVVFAARAAGLDRRSARNDAMRWLQALEAGDLADRKPGQLSGGQAQRVAIARALAADPALLLLDEPLAALDQPVAAAIRQTLRKVLAGRIAVLVTHDILDAALLADHIAVMDRGRIIESAATSEILHRPRTEFAARLCGLNLITGVAIDDETMRTADGSVVAGLAQAPLPPGSGCAATFGPASVSVHHTLPQGSVRNVVAGAIEAIAPQAHLVRIHVGPLAADVTPAALRDLQLDVGDRVYLAFKAAEVALYPT
jgi:molybdate transport system ATP-binding protein